MLKRDVKLQLTNCWQVLTPSESSDVVSCVVCVCKEYEFVMDDEIEFVQALPMAGTVNDKVCYSLSLCTVTAAASEFHYGRPA